jgi:hypothetical protein
MTLPSFLTLLFLAVLICVNGFVAGAYHVALSLVLVQCLLAASIGVFIWNHRRI